MPFLQRILEYDILLSIPGIGPTTAIIILAEMPELGTMDKRQG